MGEVDVLASSQRNKDACHRNGAGRFLTWESKIPWADFERIIVCVPIEKTPEILNAIVQRTEAPILFEKPGFLSKGQLLNFVERHPEARSRAYVAFNRIFFQSIQATKDLISKSDVVAAQSDMTEWVRNLDVRSYSPFVLARWGISNSIHMISVMFYLFPELKLERRHRIAGSKYSWHPSGDTFSGVCSIGQSEVFLQYRAKWIGAGRYSLNIDFREFSVRLWPLDTLVKITEYTKEEQYPIPVDAYKPGFYHMVEDFLGTRSMLKAYCNLGCLEKCIQMAEDMFFYDSEYS